MEIVDTLRSATADLSLSAIGHAMSSAFVICVVGLLFLRLYCRLTIGKCDCDRSMEGKTVLITGASAGIGKATAQNLASRNARVILACRNLSKARKVADDIIASTGNKNIVIKHVDLTSLTSVRKCAEDVLKTEDKLDVLINNAGIYSNKFDFTEDGYEKVFQVNHLGHFLLTLLLLELLKKSAPSRIINVSSMLYSKGKLDPTSLKNETKKPVGIGIDLYSRSKLANVLFTRELAERLSNTGVTVNALHPGMVKTDVMANGGPFGYITDFIMLILGKSIEEGAQTTIYLAVHPDLDKTSGKYFVDCQEKKVVKKALDKALAEQLYRESKQMVGLTIPT